MKKHMRTLVVPALVGLCAISMGIVTPAEAQIVPVDVARICMEDPIQDQRLDLRVYNASGEFGPAGVWLVNGIIDLGFACQVDDEDKKDDKDKKDDGDKDLPSSFWPVHGSIVAKVEPWDFSSGIKHSTRFRLNYEGGSIDLNKGCVKFKEALTCQVEDKKDDKGDDKDRQPAVSCQGFFTNIGFQANFTAASVWTPIACFEDKEDDKKMQALADTAPSGPMRGFEPAHP
jgi:hypothetical protein